MISSPNISLAKVLLIFYIFSHAASSSLFSPELNKLLQDRKAQHVLAFITTMVIVGELTPISDPKEVIFYATLTYILFLLSTKMRYQWNMLLVVLLVAGYLYDLHNQQKEKDAKSDPALDEKVLFRIRNTTITKTMIINGGIVVFILVGAVYALLNPSVEPGNQQGGGLRNFNIDNYLFGITEI